MTVSGGSGPARWLGRPMDRRSLTVWAVVVFAVLRLVSGVIIWLASAHQVPFPAWTGPDPGYLDMTVLWDGSWYREVALHGYPAPLPTGPDGLVAQNAWAFYPAFPLLARAVMALTGLSFPVVGSTIALLAGLAAAPLMAVLLARRVAPGVALGAVAVWGAFPAAPSLQLAYTESVAVLVLCAFLLLVETRHWAAAGLVALVVGVTRPIAVPLVAVLLVALALRWRDRDRPVGRREAIGGLAGLALTGVGAVVWPLVAALRTGVGSAYTDTMASWRAGHEIVPLAPWMSITRWLLRDTPNPEVLAPVALTAVAVTLVVAVLGPWAGALGPVLRTWCLAYPAYLAVVLDPFTSIFRYLLPLFPLAVVLVGGGWRGRSTPSRWTVARILVLVALGIVGQVLWVDHLLVFVPPSDYPP